MSIFDLTNGQNISALFDVLSWVVGAGSVIYLTFFNKKSDVENENATASSNLINTLKTTSELQEKELIRLRDKEVKQGQDIAHLQGQLTMLKEIFQGRDPQMGEFLKAAPELIVIARENNGLAKAQATALEALTKNIGELVKAITPPKPAPQFGIN